jgi:predicted amidohydrolase
METVVVACVQQRMSIPASREEFEAEARRFLHQAQAKMARLVVFPELAGLMLAPPLISSFKLGFIKRADQGKRPTASLISRSLGRVSGAAADVVGGGFRGSLLGLLEKNSTALRDLYCETFGGLAREFRTLLLGGSLYVLDEESQTVRNRAYLFDVSGEILGYQDKLNLSPDERGLATPGADLRVLNTRFGRIGLLLGQDALYPELARVLAVQGVELVLGIAACPGLVMANLVRHALALRVEENQVFAAASFLLGSNYLDQGDREDYFGQSALMAPMTLTERRDGVLIQAGTNRTEGLITAKLDSDALRSLWESSRFRPRREMHLGNLGPLLAEMYQQGLTIEQAIEQHIAGPVEPEPPAQVEPVGEPEVAAPVPSPDLAPEPQEVAPPSLPESTGAADLPAGTPESEG